MKKLRHYFRNNPLAADLCLFAILLITFVIWLVFFPKQYFVFSVLIVVEVLLLAMIYVETFTISAKEIALMAALATIAVVGRIIFYAVPQVKPTAALVFISGLCLGKGPGFVIGLLAMFLSNFFFGQSMSTPFQMLGMGLVGFIGGLLCKKNLKSGIKLWHQLVYAFAAVFFVYGFIVDTSAVIFMWQSQGKVAVFSVYAAGVIFNLTHALSTVIFVALLSPLLSKQLSRITRKYGLFQAKMLE